MEWSQYFGLASVPVIVALVAFVRQVGVPANWAPLAALALGIVWNVALVPLVQVDYYPAVLLGVLSGLSACGLYDVGKKGLEALKG